VPGTLSEPPARASAAPDRPRRRQALGNVGAPQAVAKRLLGPVERLLGRFERRLPELGTSAHQLAQFLGAELERPRRGGDVAAGLDEGAEDPGAADPFLSNAMRSATSSLTRLLSFWPPYSLARNRAIRPLKSPIWQRSNRPPSQRLQTTRPS
jgi:ParB-like chromosome segregation protein Spo0J